MRDKLNEKAKTRIIIFAVMLLLITCTTMSCARGMGELLWYFNLITSGEADNYLNGVDMTAVITVFTEYGMQVKLMAAALFIALLILLNLFWMLLFWIILFRKTSVVTKEEYQISVIIQRCICIVTAIICCLIIAYRSGLWGLSGIAFVLPMLLFSWLFYILPMKKVRKRL